MSAPTADYAALLATGTFDDLLDRDDERVAVESLTEATGDAFEAAAPAITAALAERRASLAARGEAIGYLGVIVHLPDGGTHVHPGQRVTTVGPDGLQLAGEGQGDGLPTTYFPGDWTSVEIFNPTRA
ncbi:hypothetical protein [Tsukamurella paurometabola]|uniref:Uncharacterized protein n=1 Tax=Tsukamurella paurometabola TaxID=2061 RepID=A0A3P8L698_TSUPA|nr:hypothetical protein [Tsukamurella paurometabola]UEA81615.1 hypothetical protein LK411_14545 [Tsukamurella paurometabola]VDR38621.1 Uncharacterised protein [Tsukamurella paurometabola]